MFNLNYFPCSVDKTQDDNYPFFGFWMWGAELEIAENKTSAVERAGVSE